MLRKHDECGDRWYQPTSSFNAWWLLHVCPLTLPLKASPPTIVQMLQLFPLTYKYSSWKFSLLFCLLYYVLSLLFLLEPAERKWSIRVTHRTQQQRGQLFHFIQCCFILWPDIALSWNFDDWATAICFSIGFSTKFNHFHLERRIFGSKLEVWVKRDGTNMIFRFLFLVEQNIYRLAHTDATISGVHVTLTTVFIIIQHRMVRGHHLINKRPNKKKTSTEGKTKPERGHSRFGSVQVYLERVHEHCQRYDTLTHIHNIMHPSAPLPQPCLFQLHWMNECLEISICVCGYFLYYFFLSTAGSIPCSRGAEIDGIST